MIHAVVVEGPEVKRTEAELKKQAATLSRRASAATRRVVQRDYKPVLIGMLPAFMPNRYAAALDKDLVVRTSVRFAGPRPRVTALISAPGGFKGGRRVRRLEAGILWHPLFGNRKSWHMQTVRRGFAKKSLEAVSPLIVRELDDELKKITAELKAAAK